MWKKSIPLLMATGLVLTACGNNNGALPNNNETPMQDVNDRTNQWVPDNGDNNDVNNFDGFQDNNGNGTMNGGGGNNGNNGGGTMNNGGTGTNDGLIDNNGNGMNRLNGDNGNNNGGTR
jgi:hypothetical protein